MVDEGSASAAELLAAAIQENHRGVLVGAKTSGAVEASVMIDLSDGSALQISGLHIRDLTLEDRDGCLEPPTEGEVQLVSQVRHSGRTEDDVQS